MTINNAPQKMLPSWLEAVLPEAKAPHWLTIADNGKKLRVIAPDESFEDFDDLESVSEYLQLNDYDFIIGEEVSKLHSDEIGLISFETEHGIGVLFEHNDQRRREVLENAYKAFLELRVEYLNEPSSFYNAWHFINCHPAFWTCHDVRKSPWYWNTAEHCAELSQYVMKDAEGNTVVQLDTGAHVSNDNYLKPYTTHYGDWRLEVEAPNYETAIIELAHRVNLVFNAEGEDVAGDDFPYETPEWVIELQGKLAELKSCKEKTEQ